MKLSAKILVRDAGQTIEQCLKSIKPFVDEIICIIDSRSKDNSERICFDYTPFVYHYDWQTDSFADARNYGISKCTGSHILIIDSDEILKSFEQPPENAEIIYCTVLKDGLTFPDIRMIKNNIGIIYSNARHNELKMNRIYDEYKSTIVIEDTTHLTPEQAAKKTRSLLERHLKQETEEPENDGLYYHISQCYRYFQDWTNAVKYARRALDKPINNPHKAQACITLYLGYNAQGKPYSAIFWLYKSLEYCPEQLTAKILIYEQMLAENNIELQKVFKDDIENTNISYLPLDYTKESFKQLFIN